MREKISDNISSVVIFWCYPENNLETHTKSSANSEDEGGAMNIEAQHSAQEERTRRLIFTLISTLRTSDKIGYVESHAHFWCAHELRFSKYVDNHFISTQM
jgi:hypothetical protein